MLVEPQRVLPGWTGVTYRYWDWNRRYDATGTPTPDGTPRDLHVEHALAVTDWDRVTQPAFVDSVRVRAGAAPTTQPASVQWLTSAGDAALRAEGGDADSELERPPLSRDLVAARLAGSGPIALPSWPLVGAAALCVLEGAVTSDAGERFERGETLALAALGQTFELHQAHALLMAARPASSTSESAGSRP